MPDTLYWQDGYGPITLRGAEIPKVVEYIEKQKQHHQVGTVSVLLERVEE